MIDFDDNPDGTPVPPMSVMDLVFLGFNSRVIAFDQETGAVVWEWKSHKGRGSYVAVLLDGERLVVSVQGYTYCLDPVTGTQLWDNPLKGYGLGIPSLVSMRGNSGSAGAAAIIAQHAAAAAGATG